MLISKRQLEEVEYLLGLLLGRRLAASYDLSLQGIIRNDAVWVVVQPRRDAVEDVLRKGADDEVRPLVSGNPFDPEEGLSALEPRSSIRRGEDGERYAGHGCDSGVGGRVGGGVGGYVIRHLGWGRSIRTSGSPLRQQQERFEWICRKST